MTAVGDTRPARASAPEPPGRIRITPDEVHVWRMSLARQGSPGERESAWGLLATDERAKARRYRFRDDRERYAAARAHLRLVLSGYLGEDPREIRFCYGKNDKPALVASAPEGRLQFSLSHCGEVMLVAIALTRRVGVDLERVRRSFDGVALGDFVFSARELAVLRSLGHRERAEACSGLWTAKEAFLKATGEGLSRPLAELDVSAIVRAPTLCLRDGARGEEPVVWTIRRMCPGYGYSGAVAAEGYGWGLRCRTYPPGGRGLAEADAPRRAAGRSR